MRPSPIFSILALSTAATAAACSSSSNTGGPDAGATDASALDAGAAGDGGDGGISALGFTPANVDLSGIDLSTATDETTSSDCEMRTTISSCFAHATPTTLKQSDGSEIAVYVVKSWRVETTVHVSLTSLSGNTPIVVVSLGDMTILGTIDGHAQDVHAAPGGYETVPQMAGSGPGGGAKGDANVGADGASYCGQGGQGAVVQASGATPAAKSAAWGNPEIVPIHGGASGGSSTSGQGGAGGAGLELVAGGAFTMGPGSYINVGGGGGGFGGTGSGGGTGGSLLIQAATATISGTLAANGGGGAGSGVGGDVGKNGSNDAVPAPGGPGTALGGTGSAGATIDGANAPPPTQPTGAGGGGGGAGRIRIDTKSGSADISKATISPAPTTPCTTQGTLG